MGADVPHSRAISSSVASISRWARNVAAAAAPQLYREVCMHIPFALGAPLRSAGLNVAATPAR